ncbi:MAG: DUF5682 family protein [Myxococcaceae bacterium]|nr:DUF5682 family protein [Myxococcaceae bacterium]
MAALSEATRRALTGVHLFPVRHHSPRTSAVLRSFLDATKPKVVLVEGPQDAEVCLDVLLDAETVPPVAILGYRTDGQSGSSLYPFASYSPEYVALKWARQHHARAHFIDLTLGQSLGYQRPEHAAGDDAADGDADDEPDEAPLPPSMDERIVAATGFRSFEEFWEASFEAPAHEPEGFRRALLAWADLIRHEGTRVTYHRARDALMARLVTEVVERGVDPSHVVVVVGAAHAAAFAQLDVDPALEAHLERTVPTAVTMIPYSFTRLAEQTGYGAGNRAPRYYQRAHDANVDFRRATLEVLCEFTDHLRLRGFTVSLADTIEAYRLATMLSDLRGKSGPGLDEVRDASIATLCRGEAQHVDGFLWSTVIGHAIGKVASRIGRNSLQQEFWREVDHRRLPKTDEAAQFTLKLNDPVQVDTSVFLHRLRVADVPYAAFVGSSAGRGAKKGDVEDAGGHAALSRVREVWEGQWTPSTDVALVERIVDGDSLQQVCERRLSRALDAATSTGATAHVLMEAVVTLAPEVMARALAATDRLASTDDDLPSLASACRALSGLASYGSSRKATALGDEVLASLCAKTFERAVLRLRSACTGTDEAVGPAREALKTLHDLALSQRLVDGESWFTEAHALVGSYVVHPTCAGLACGLLYLAQRLSEADVAQVVQQRLSALSDPEAAAGFLAGFFEVNALVLVKSRPVVQALDAFLLSIEPERFKDTLPTLRRAFSPLGPTERRYLLENLLGLRKLQEHAREAQAVIAEKDKDTLKALGTDMAKVMDDLDDLL